VGSDSRPQARTAQGRRRHHVQHQPLQAELRKQDRTADLPHPGLMPAFWKRKRGRAGPTADLREIIEHFNKAAEDEENFSSTIDPRIYHVRLILDYFGD